MLSGRTLGAYGPSATALTLESLVEGVARVRTEIEPDNRTVMRKLAAGCYGEDGPHSLQPAGLVKVFGYSFGLSRQNVDLAQAQAFARTLYDLCRTGRTAEVLKPYGLPPSPCVR